MTRIRCFDQKFPPAIAVGMAILAFVVGVIIAGTVFAASWETSSVRTASGGLIRIGMTRQEALKELGQAEQPRRNSSASGKTGKKGGSVNYRGNDGLYTITFSGERVVKIMVTPNRD